jgi:hypothetical protein
MKYFFELVRLEKLWVDKRPIEEVAYELDHRINSGLLDYASDKKVVSSIMNQLESKGMLSERQADYLRKSLAYDTIYRQMY